MDTFPSIEKRVKTYHAQRSSLDEIRRVWKCGETLSRVFDIWSQSKLNLKNSMLKISQSHLILTSLFLFGSGFFPVGSFIL